jgi:hypothetical protein
MRTDEPEVRQTALGLAGLYEVEGPLGFTAGGLFEPARAHWAESISTRVA